MTGRISPEYAVVIAATTGTDTVTDTGTDTDTTTDISTTFEILSDPSGHVSYIGMPVQIANQIHVNGSIFGFSGSTPFVNVTGTINGAGNFSATGIGTVAGYSNVSVNASGTWDGSSRSGTYEMGANGELPGGESIIYAIQGQH
ncbi:MAG TPA: hypothetical protein DCG57_16385 [Candidatus Riflebacteria bacterium]|jgi:hypothetical protein|nr:hypothetical protein [Candidatus Riflebacteria bacterium]